MSLLWIFSIAVTPGLSGSGLLDRNEQQLLSLFSLFRCLSDVRSFSNAVPVQFPCSSHLLHEIRYTKFYVICVLMLYCRPVLLLLKVLQVVISAQHLQRLLALPVLVGGGEVSTLQRTSMSFKLRGRLNAIRGGLGIALWSLREVWSIGRCFLVIFTKFTREGWYVTTRGILFSGGWC